MRVPRLYTDRHLAPDSEVVLDTRSGHYVQRVLRLRAGDALVLFNGDGSDYAAELLDNRRDRVALHVNARLPAVAPPRLHLVLVQAVGKGDRMDTSLQKATELGVGVVQPLFTERTEVRLAGGRLDKRMVHWRGVLTAACEQSGRATVPELRAPLGLDDWLATDPAGARWVMAPGAERPLTQAALHGERLELAVGPEGGFSDAEAERLRRAGCETVSLGARVLRTETAGPAALAVIQALWGDFAAD